MWQARAVNPGHVIEIDGIDDQRIAFPPAYRMPHPPGIFVFGMLATLVGIDFADEVIEFVEEVDRAGNLHDFGGEWMNPNARHARREAADFLARGRIHQ